MIGFAGLSHLGLVSSVAAAAKGCDVLAYDADAALVTALAAGHLSIHEPGLAEALAECRDRLHFTADARELRECDVNYVSLDVPTGADNQSDLTPLDALLAQVADNSAPGTTLVLLSQAPPGTTRRWAERLAGVEGFWAENCGCEATSGSLPPWGGGLGWGGDHQQRPGQGLRKPYSDLHLFYQVETLIFGRALERALRPERLIVGCADPDRDLPPAYAELLALFNCPVFRMRYESAELTKIAINMFLVSSVSVTNTLASLCEQLGADWAEIVPTLRLDARIGPHAYLSPGLGLSGGNLERDLATVRRLAAAVGSDAGIVDAWLANSRQRRDWVLRRLHAEILSLLDHPTVALWGLAYKPDTASTKNAPALALLDALDGIPVRAYDPQAVVPAAGRPLFRQTATPLDACADADALVVMTPWPAFTAIDLGAVREAMRGRTIIDPLGCLDRARCRQEGFDYYRLGEPGEKIRMSKTEIRNK